MAENIVSLEYFSFANAFYFINIDNIEPQHKCDFIDFIDNIVTAVNIRNPRQNVSLETTVDEEGNVVSINTVLSENVGEPIGFLTRSTGEGAIPFLQGIQLANLPPENTLTNLLPDVHYTFDFTVQDVDYTFSAIGSTLQTFDQIEKLLVDNMPVSTTFRGFGWQQFLSSSEPTNQPYIEVINNVRPRFGGILGNGSENITSVIECRTFANVNYADADGTGFNIVSLANANDENRLGTAARIRFPFAAVEAKDILTFVDSDEETVFSFDIGTTRRISVRGFQARTYQDLVDTIDSVNGVNCVYTIGDNTERLDHAFYLYIPLPKLPRFSRTATDRDETDPIIISRNARERSALTSFSGSDNKITIRSFAGLAKNSEFVHILTDSIYGGYSMLEVMLNSRRSNGSYWTEIAMVENETLSQDEVVSEVDEQREVIEEIEEEDVPAEVRRTSSVNIRKLLEAGTILATGVAVTKSRFLESARDQISNVFDSFTSPPDEAEECKIDPLANIIDTGFDSDALDSDGNVIDESLLTPPQANQLVPPARILIE